MENNKVLETIYGVLEKHIQPELMRIALLGGSWYNGGWAGVFYWGLIDGVGGRNRSIGSRVCDDERCWKIYNRIYPDDEIYNIIVHFNDNDEITHVTYIDDSKCEAFEKDFMYSIYEDLKKYEIESEEKVDTEHEAEVVVNECIRKEAINTDITIDVENSHETRKTPLKIVNAPKFDLEYFQRGFGYHVCEMSSSHRKVFHGVIVEVTEDLLRIMKLESRVHYETAEVIEIPLKAYLSGDWYIDRLEDAE